MTQLSPYLAFHGNCREAMNFYKDCLGGELNLMTAGDSGAQDMAPEMKDKIMHAQLESGSMTLMASDMFMGEEVAQGNTISLCFNGTDLEEMTSIHKKLSEGAKHVKELKTEFWGATYGEVVDKFGFRWMFNCNKA